jgi:hypothetical protein
MTSRNRVRIAVVSAGVLAVGLISFFAVSAAYPSMNTGPLGNGGTPGGICAPLASGQPLSWGITYLGNTGGSDAVITKVDLVNPRNARLVASYVVPITGTNEYGSMAGYPPPQHLPPGVDWGAHQRVPGARVPPAQGRDHADLVTVIQPTGPGPLAEVQAIDVFYQESGTNYHMQTHYRFVLLVGTTCPDDWPDKYPG